MHKYAKLLDELVSLVNIEQYGVRGVLRGEKLLVGALKEGAANAYVFDGEKLVKLNKEPINSILSADYGVGRVVVSRDVAKGREQHLLYEIDPGSPGVEKTVRGVKPARIMGGAYDDHRIVYVASTPEENAVYMAGGSGVEKIASLPGFAVILDMKWPLAVGYGVFKPVTGRFQLLVVDLESREAEIYEPPSGSIENAIVSPGGEVVFSLLREEDAVLMVLDPGTMKARELELPGKDLEEYKPVGFNFISYTPDGSFIAVARKNGRSRIFLDGRLVDAPEGMHGGVYVWRGELVTTHTSLSTPPRIISLGSKPRVLLSSDIPGFVWEALGKPSFYWVESFDKEKVPVFVLESKRAGKPGPTVVLVHGGPFSEDADVWSIFAASLALAGFHVVMPNYRGSTGYGEKWRMKIIGDPCRGELEDIDSAAEWALSSGLASRLYIMGYSYGGYMTMCALTRKPGRYKAGVAGASVIDWEEMYELSDAAFRSFINMLFAGKRELWRERSPITYVDNLRDPLLIVHPQNDSRTPLKPVLRFMEKAVEKNKAFEAYIAPDIGHAINKIDDLLKILWPAILFLVRQEEALKQTS